MKVEEEANENKCNFNIAKCLYEKVNLLMDSFDNQQSGGIYQRKMYFEGKKKEIFDALKEVKQRIKNVQKNNSKLHKVAQVN